MRRDRMHDPWLSRFHTAAFIEGLSYLALLGIAMPLKYFAGWPLAVRVVGMAHGVLFVAYVLLVALLLARGTQSVKWGLWALFLSVIPFGTFVLTRERAASR
jgi:integral membrane protein